MKLKFFAGLLAFCFVLPLAAEEPHQRPNLNPGLTESNEPPEAAEVRLHRRVQRRIFPMDG
jgi:hypothetical protein